MQNRPTTTELLETVRELLMAEIVPAIQDDGLRFKVLIAGNILSIVGRELIAGEQSVTQEFNRLVKLLPDSPDAAAQPSGQVIAALNAQLAVAIRAAPSQSTAIMPDGAIWTHVKQTLRDQLTIANPKFLL